MAKTPPTRNSAATSGVTATTCIWPGEIRTMSPIATPMATNRIPAISMNFVITSPNGHPIRPGHRTVHSWLIFPQTGGEGKVQFSMTIFGAGLTSPPVSTAAQT